MGAAAIVVDLHLPEAGLWEGSSKLSSCAGLRDLVRRELLDVALSHLWIAFNNHWLNTRHFLSPGKTVVIQWQ